MAEMILTTSGFALPANQYYTPFTEDVDVADDIINIRRLASVSDGLTDYFKVNHVNNSSLASILYRKYQKDPSFDNFMEIVDFVTSILRSVSVLDFVEAQIRNPHVPPTSITFLEDLVTGKFDKYQAYNQLPSSFRFVPNTGLTESAAARLTESFAKRGRDAVASNGYRHSVEPATTWVKMFEKLMLDKGDFVAFFRYVFVHRY